MFSTCLHAVKVNYASCVVSIYCGCHECNHSVKYDIKILATDNCVVVKYIKPHITYEFDGLDIVRDMIG